MLKKYLLVSAVALGVLSMTAQAQATGVDEIKNLSKLTPAVAKRDEVLKSDSWAYKTLKNLYSAHGVLMDIPKEKFNGTGSLTRNEAALILVNLLGKIEKDKVVLSDLDKERIAALTDQLKQEIGMLTARVTRIETSVDALNDEVGTLQGQVSDLEYSDSKKAEFGFGEKFKVGGMFRGQFATNFQGKTHSEFSLPLAEISLSGKPAEHVNYFVLLNPGYGRIGDWEQADAKQIIDRAYVQTDIIPNHKLTIGKQVVPILDMTSKFYSEVDTAEYFPQIGPLGLDRQAGIKLAGDYKYLTYQAGIFSRNVADDDNNGLAYSARAGIKPLANFDKFGNLELGSSIYVSDKNTNWGPLSLIPSAYHDLLNDRSTSIFTLYGKYKYKDFELVSEFLNQTNYIDIKTMYLNPYQVLNPAFAALSGGAVQLTPSDVKYTDTRGWYAQASYFVTPKVQLVGRFDTMRNDIGSVGLGQQYLAGINYYLKYPNLKLLTNYVCSDFKGQKVSNKIILQTQYLF